MQSEYTVPNTQCMKIETIKSMFWIAFKCRHLGYAYKGTAMAYKYKSSMYGFLSGGCAAVIVTVSRYQV